MNSTSRYMTCSWHGVLHGMLVSMLFVAAFSATAQNSQHLVENTNVTASRIELGHFGSGLDHWTEIQLDPSVPVNQFTLEQWDGRQAVKVQSDASMSLLARQIDVNLARTPLLCWQWRIDAPLHAADMNLRSGDDYAARLYVSLSLPENEKGFLLNTQLGIARAIWGPDVPDAAINYVWDNKMPVGTQQPNAYTDRATMVVLQTGKNRAGMWVNESRNLLEDMTRLYSANATVTQIAIGADTDNTGESVTTGFANLHLASADGCQFETDSTKNPERRR